jgi:transaldolase
VDIFLDSADVGAIRELTNTGLIDGVTTNQTSIAASGKKLNKLLDEILAFFTGTVSIPVTGTDLQYIIEESIRLSSIAKNVVIKLPITLTGLQAAYALLDADCLVNMTLCFSACQALAAFKMGASFVSPFVGRLQDVGQDGMKLVSDMVAMRNNYGFDSRILVSSVRNVNDISGAAVLGADAVTIPPQMVEQLLTHELTNAGLAKFDKDWNSYLNKTS